MNRKERRATSKQAPGPDAGTRLFGEARTAESQGRLDDAVRAYKRLLTLQPSHAEAANNLGRILQAIGQPREASERYTQALMLMPQLLQHYGGVLGTLAALLPPLMAALRAASAQDHPDFEALFPGTSFDAIADDPLLLCVLQSTPVRDIAFERVLTAARSALIAGSADTASPQRIAFAGALARQCFINEFVFALDDRDRAAVASLAAALAGGSTLEPMQVAALAMVGPLHGYPGAERLTAQRWPAPIDAVLAQQWHAPAQERALRESIPRLTAIDDTVSRAVQRQYEENPYPRWVLPAGGVVPVALDSYLRNQFPTAPFEPLGAAEHFDLLIAGCGTGWHAVSLTQALAGAQVLAVDLSLSSLAYAKRNTPPALAGRITYAQADILQLGALTQRFDAIDSSGVLHHMADPFAGWRILLGLLKPGGFMHLGFYSERGRQDVVAARAFIAERGYGASADEIRRCRQDLLATPLRSLARTDDFFTTSECRDLLFHVQEHRTTIPALKAFIEAEGLTFLGFEFDDAHAQHYRARFAAAGWALTDLDRWHAVESEFPDTFAGMYQFWVQQR